MATVKAISDGKNECSDRAIVSAVSQQHHKMTSVIIAEESGTLLFLCSLSCVCILQAMQN